MRLRKRIAIVGSLLLAFLFAGLIYLAWEQKEPTYKGKKLSYWLQARRPASLPKSEVHRSYDAISRIGTNGIPTLLRMLCETDDSPKNRVLSFLSKHLTKVQYYPARELNYDALYGFVRLGTNAASGVPELIRIYERAVSASSKDAAAIALRFIGPHAESALPVLINDFHHTNFRVRLEAVSALIEIPGDPKLVVPALRSALKDPTAEVRGNALVALQRYGADARLALPEMLTIFQNASGPNSNILKRSADRTMWLNCAG